MSTFRIGLDGRALGNINRRRGIGRYTAHIIEGLVSARDRNRFTVFGYGEEPEERFLDSDTVEWRGLPEPRLGSRFSTLEEYVRLARVVNEEQLQLFHGIDHNLSPFIRCPTLVTVHDLIPLVLRGPYLGPTAWMQLKAHYRASRRAEFVVAVSESTRADVMRLWKLPGARVKVVPEGVDERYRPVTEEATVEKTRKKYGIEKPYFLYLGGFDPRKNILNTLLGFKRFILRTNREHQLVLAGGAGTFAGYLSEQIDELGLNRWIVLPGFIEEEELPALYSGAAVFVFLSLYEGFGLPLLEAMACGTPLLTSRVSSIPEVVGEAGLYVEPLEPASIAEGMDRLVSDDGLREDLVRNGRSRSSGFTWENAAGEILSLYSKVLRGDSIV